MNEEVWNDMEMLPSMVFALPSRATPALSILWSQLSQECIQINYSFSPIWNPREYYSLIRKLCVCKLSKTQLTISYSVSFQRFLDFYRFLNLDSHIVVPSNCLAHKSYLKKKKMGSSHTASKEAGEWSYEISLLLRNYFNSCWTGCSYINHFNNFLLIITIQNAISQLL